MKNCKDGTISCMPQNLYDTWYHSDSEEHYLDNVKNQKDALIDNGWYENFSITYQLDSQGFRNPPDSQIDGSILTLGCSHTLGTGLNRELIWPHLVAGELGKNYYNAAVSGSSTDTAFRILEYLLQHNKPIGVLLFAPDSNRWELLTNGGAWFNYSPQKYDMFDKVFNHMHIDEERNRLNYTKNILAMHKLCDDRGIPFVYAERKDVPYVYDFARDLQHAGPRWQREVADIMIQRLSEHRYKL